MTQGPWKENADSASWPRVRGSISVDVAIVGGGLTGITTALLLKRSGRKVALIEKGRLACGETGRTTAHLTEVIDSRYQSLLADYGLEGARLVAESSRAAIELIAQLVEEFRISCDFKRVPAYLYSESEIGDSDLQKEVWSARKVGLQASWVTEVPLPFQIAGAMRVENQAQFDPRRYLLSLASRIPGEGSHVFEESLVRDIRESGGSPCEVTTEQGVVFARDVVVATDAAMVNRFFLHTKIAAYRTYAVSYSGKLAPGLFWDNADPYHYIREHEGQVIVGGEDHKVGAKKDTTECFRNLENYAREKFRATEFSHRWSGQILEPIDGLPFIGRNSLSRHIFVATGYSGNGMTFGTIAAKILSDQILGRANPWSSFYAATRIAPLSSLPDFLLENKDYPTCMVKDRVLSAEARSLEEIRSGEGKLLSHEGSKIAVYRDEGGKVHAVSPICTHMGCHVRFNNAEKSWDCPCHGSRFSVDGEVLHGPAVAGLAPKLLSKDRAA
jgi:glycine/D-amino acid oxidase-like deaminating enzyme/nitrite reductase/ring-hydroxylating ferredoxin subunit